MLQESVVSGEAGGNVTHLLSMTPMLKAVPSNIPSETCTVHDGAMSLSDTAAAAEVVQMQNSKDCYQVLPLPLPDSVLNGDL